MIKKTLETLRGLTEGDEERRRREREAQAWGSSDRNLLRDALRRGQISVLALDMLRNMGYEDAAVALNAPPVSGSRYSWIYIPANTKRTREHTIVKRAARDALLEGMRRVFARNDWAIGAGPARIEQITQTFNRTVADPQPQRAAASDLAFYCQTVQRELVERGQVNSPQHRALDALRIGAMDLSRGFNTGFWQPAFHAGLDLDEAREINRAALLRAHGL